MWNDEKSIALLTLLRAYARVHGEDPEDPRAEGNDPIEMTVSELVGVLCESLSWSYARRSIAVHDFGLGSRARSTLRSSLSTGERLRRGDW